MARFMFVFSSSLVMIGFFFMGIGGLLAYAGQETVGLVLIVGMTAFVASIITLPFQISMDMQYEKRRKQWELESREDT